MNDLVLKVLRACDVLLAPFLVPAALLMKAVRRVGMHRLPLCRRVLMDLGVFPIRRHYYEPLFDARDLRESLRVDRRLPAVDLDPVGQLAFVAQCHYGAELADLPSSKPQGGEAGGFHFNNGAFESGDAELWYGVLRHRKPRVVIEIGSGYSTLLAVAALARNRQDDPSYQVRHICVEPYEAPWLQTLGVELIRTPVERLSLDFFAQLSAGDVLFIDSSHVIRPQGDVLFEYLQILPSLSEGVLVHVHDIFTPRDYLDDWVREEVRLWNEQYLLEAFLCSNRDWRVVAALNYLQHNHYDALKAAAPFLTPDREPGSFYLLKTRS